VVGLALGFTTITLGAVLIEWFVFDPVLQYVTLFYGVFFGTYAIRDIYDDLITRRAEGSDAMACHELYPCCLPRCVGVQFWFLAVIFQIVGLYLAMVWLMSAND
jgi:Peptidase M50B-like